MPYEYAMDRERELLVVRGSGVLDLPEVEALTHAVCDDPSFRPGLRILVDFAEVTELSLFHDDVLRLVDLHGQLKERVGEARIAIFAPRDAVYGVGRMWHSLQPEWEAETALFRTRPEAVVWLGFPPDATLPGDPPADRPQSPGMPA